MTKLLHMTNLQCMLSCCDLRCFDATFMLSHFTHFCVDQKLTQKSCPWSKNDKYDVCLQLPQLPHYNGVANHILPPCVKLCRFFFWNNSNRSSICCFANVGQNSFYDELREDVMIWVVETRIFESDQSELQSVVPTLYVVNICGNCILNAKNSKKQFKRSISLFSLCVVESSLLKSPIFDENSRNKNAFFSMFATSMT